MVFLSFMMENHCLQILEDHAHLMSNNYIQSFCQEETGICRQFKNIPSLDPNSLTHFSPIFSIINFFPLSVKSRALQFTTCPQSFLLLFWGEKGENSGRLLSQNKTPLCSLSFKNKIGQQQTSRDKSANF